MFEKLTTLFTTNEDQFTRTQNQFVEQWNNVVECLSSRTAMLAPNIYDTKASVHIADMIYMIEHDKIPDDSDYGPCVEFILQNEVLSTLQLHAQNDIPVGLRRIVLAFFSQLVQKLQRSVIPHLHIHKPLQNMICVCGGGKYPIDEINFLTSVLGKFHEDPSLVNLFMGETRSKNGTVNYELRIVDALISLSHSKEDRVVKKSCESLLMCVSADSEYIIDSVLSYTILVQDLVSRLCQRYNSFQSDPDLLLTTTISWNTQLEAVMAGSLDKATVRLLLWLDYLNSVATSSHPNFVNKLLRHLAKVFLHTHILNDFKSSQPLDVVKALAMCQKMLGVVTSELLLVEVLKFLTDDPVITTLCSLLNNEDTRVLTSVLTLLCELFETRHSLVVETLVLRYTRKNVSVRSKLLLEREEEYRPILIRANSSDSGVDEMYSDEETSFIHMDTSMVNHFEADQQSPSLARKLQELEISENTVSSEGRDTQQHDCVTSLNIDVTSSNDNVTSSQNATVSLHEHVTSSENNVDSSENNTTSLENNANLSEHNVMSSENNVNLSENNVTSSENNANLSENNANLSETNAVSTENNVTSSENCSTSSVPQEAETSSQDGFVIDATSSAGGSIPSEQSNCKSVSTDSVMGELDSSSSTSLSISEINYEPLDSGNPETYGKSCEENSVADKVTSDSPESIVISETPQEEPNFPENIKPINPAKEALKSSSITLEHNRVGSPNHFKTVIVSHDQAEDSRKGDKNGKITLKLEASVAKFVELMPVLDQPKMAGFNEYLYDAHLKAEEVMYAYSWIPAHYSSIEDDDLISDIGVFLEKVFSMVQSIPYQSYMVNMLLMSLVSEIVHIPHDSVTLLLLDTSLPSPPLYNALLDISREFRDIFEASPTLKDLLRTELDYEMPDVCRAAFLTEEFLRFTG
ncbi:uncharacterized protein LOC134820577 isoform X2 [Bolinopsis microptera]|uniref:uncharacterized protein LOC134820577 isoform X2 n=1 Tax=Bolinopsis microptera TaxID=2820187 RepID=UPI003079523E